MPTTQQRRLDRIADKLFQQQIKNLSDAELIHAYTILKTAIEAGDLASTADLLTQAKAEAAKDAQADAAALDAQNCANLHDG
ncbi:MAG: hypothetical protein DRI81_07215 [Chloroflexi bacterium]|nr:MAG: hypothetical protein DRI81_07215 [Chloroflexota bacterium]